uniref:Uncharacterized protein n=1 Tax=Tetraselmis chuii TaxID=63592 RepID=A0A7S1ST50_9CHLO
MDTLEAGGAGISGVASAVLHGNCGIQDAVVACRRVAESLEFNWDKNWHSIRRKYPRLTAVLKQLKSLCNWACHSEYSKRWPNTIVTQEHMDDLVSSLETVVDAFEECRKAKNRASTIDDKDLCKAFSSRVRLTN